jgi:hypothetical protein
MLRHNLYARENRIGGQALRIQVYTMELRLPFLRRLLRYQLHGFMPMQYEIFMLIGYAPCLLFMSYSLHSIPNRSTKKCDMGVYDLLTLRFLEALTADQALDIRKLVATFLLLDLKR